MQYVEMPSLSFIVNGQPYGHVTPSRGLRQGDPLSPYLFLFCAKGLLRNTNRPMQLNACTGHRISALAPLVSHLLFMDDSLIFCKANIEQATVVKTLLNCYERASGQKVNCDKSNSYFTKGRPQACRARIMDVLGFLEASSFEKYLGLPTYIGRSR